MTQLGAQEGFVFTFGGRIGNTRDSHRLIQLGRQKDPDIEDNLAMAIMHMFFEKDGDITSWEHLSEAAAGVGIPWAETMAWLRDGSGGQEVDKEVEEAYARGFKGVPTFVVNDKYEVDGAADVSEFLDCFVKAKDGIGGTSSEVPSSDVCAEGRYAV